jgi:hypothetical protein
MCNKRIWSIKNSDKGSVKTLKKPQILGINGKEATCKNGRPT